MNSGRPVVGCLATLVVLALALQFGGAVAADDHAPHQVTIETESVTTNTTAMVEITVTNNQDSDMVSPLVEIPLRNGLTVAEENRSVQSGTEFVDGVTVETASGQQDRTAFIEASTFRGTDAVFVEGVEVPSGEQRTYTVPLTVEGTSEVTLEADVRPLNNEAQNERVARSIDPIALGTIDASVVGSDAAITISGSAIGNETENGATVTSVPGDRRYTVSANLSVVERSVSISNLAVDEFETAVLTFTEPAATSPVEPTVVAQTGSDATVVDGSRTRSTTRGTAETRTTQTVTFDLSAASGRTVAAVGTAADLPMERLLQTPGFADTTLRNGSDGGTVAVVTVDGAVDDTATIEFEGRFVGDVTGDDDVTSADAAAIAEQVAANDTATLTQYADVTNSGDVSVVDAMQAQQYAEGNRTADYDLTGGSQ